METPVPFPNTEVKLPMLMAVVSEKMPNHQAVFHYFYKPILINFLMKVIAISGYFDPLHIGHLEYIKLAKNLGDKLIVIINNDKQTILKKGKFFMPLEERIEILKGIKYIDEVFVSIDKDRTVCNSLKKINPDVFAKGGDRFGYEIPEGKICKELNIKIIDGLGNKVQSSSKLIKESEIKKIERNWGYYIVLEKDQGYKIKKIEVKPKHRLSLQKHKHRSEHWVIVSGIAKVINDNSEIILHENQSTYIPKNTIHRLENIGNTPLKILEVACGDYIEEDDIIRINDDYGRK